MTPKPGSPTRPPGFCRQGRPARRQHPPPRHPPSATPKPYLDYATALTIGWSAATDVIEGARHRLVKDRVDITRARWGLDGAEAILRVRAVISNGDFDQYWRYHLRKEHERVHRPLPRKLRPRCVINSPRKSRTQLPSRDDTKKLVLRQFSWATQHRTTTHPPRRGETGTEVAAGTAIRRQPAASTPPARSAWVN
jgi:hypothetical protein